MPTRKWWAATITGLGAIATLLLTGARDVISDQEIEVIVGFVVQRLVAYLVPNDPTPGGVPAAKPSA